MASSFAPSPPSPSWPSSSSSRTPSRSRSPAPSYLSTGSGVEETLEALLGRLRLGSPSPPSASPVRPPPARPPQVRPPPASPPPASPPPASTSPLPPWLQPARLGVPSSWLCWSTSGRRRCVTQSSWVAAGGYGVALSDSSPSSQSVHSEEGRSWAPPGPMATEAARPSRCSSRSSSGFCSLSSVPHHGATSQRWERWEQWCPLVQLLLRAHAQVHPGDCASAALPPLTPLTTLLPHSPLSPATYPARSTHQKVTPQNGAECCCVRGSCARSSRSSRGSCSSQTSSEGEADSHPSGQGPAVQQPLWKMEGLRLFLLVFGCSSVLANVALASYIYTR